MSSTTTPLVILFPHASAYAEAQDNSTASEECSDGGCRGLSPGGGDSIVAAVAGTRIPPPATLTGANEPGESPTPAGEPGNMLVPVDECRPEGGECRGAYVQARIALNAAVGRTIGLSALGQALAQRYVAA